MTSRSEPLIVSPGGRYREGLDGGLILPLSLDPSRATEALVYWRMEGISFALVPLVPGATQEAEKPHRKLTPANRAHLDLFTQPGFYAWAGLPEGDEQAAHEWLKARLGLASLSELTTEQLTKTQLDLARSQRRANGNRSSGNP